MVPSFAGILFCVILSVLQDLREFHDEEEDEMRMMRIHVFVLIVQAKLCELSRHT